MEIKNEKDFIENLSDLSRTKYVVNWDLLTKDSKNTLTEIENEFNEYIKNTEANTEASEEERLSKLNGALDIWDKYKDAIKGAICKVPMSSLEIKELIKKTHQSVKYNYETIFYGLHLKKYLLDTLPVTKGSSDYTNYDIECTFSMSIALYHILATVEVTGLNKENYAFASLLHKMSEISKIYQEYDNSSMRMDNNIKQWLRGFDIQKDVNTEEQAKEKAQKIIAE
jgi:hypothetical protein